MDASIYQQESLATANGVDLILALYNAMIRFLYRAKDAVDVQDVQGRRVAIKKVLDILMYLQARLRMDVGGQPAVALSDFYGAMFTLTLEASHFASQERLDHVIACVRNVRDAWLVVARDPDANKILPRDLKTREERLPARVAPPVSEASSRAAGWSA